MDGEIKKAGKATHIGHKCTDPEERKGLIGHLVIYAQGW